MDLTSLKPNKTSIGDWSEITIVPEVNTKRLVNGQTLDTIVVLGGEKIPILEDSFESIGLEYPHLFESSKSIKNFSSIVSTKPNNSDFLIITYGGNVTIAVEAAEKIFFDEEILVNIIVLSSVKPIDKEFVIKSAKECGKIIILEEGNVTGGWGAEVSSIIHENSFALGIQLIKS